jgi:DNA-binding NarL/FixJ family response regulator
MKIRNTHRIKIAVEKEAQDEVSRNKAGILIVGDDSIVRQELAELINRKPDIGICIEVGNTEQLRDTISKQQIDLAIVDISSNDTNGFKVADTIKLQCPNVPIVLLSVHNEALHTEHTLQAETKESLLSRQTTGQIIKAIRYAKSLLRSQIFGFTLVVNLEGSPKNDYSRN